MLRVWNTGHFKDRRHDVPRICEGINPQTLCCRDCLDSLKRTEDVHGCTTVKHIGRVEGPPEPELKDEGQGPYGSSAVETPITLYNK